METKKKGQFIASAIDEGANASIYIDSDGTERLPELLIESFCRRQLTVDSVYRYIYIFRIFYIVGGNILWDVYIDT